MEEFEFSALICTLISVFKDKGHISALYRYQIEAVSHYLILLSSKACIIARVKTYLRKIPKAFLELILPFFFFSPLFSSHRFLIQI